MLKCRLIRNKQSREVVNQSKADSVSNNAVNVYKAIALHLMDHLMNLNVIRVTDEKKQTVSSLKKERRVAIDITKKNTCITSAYFISKLLPVKMNLPLICQPAAGLAKIHTFF
jgi:hypothetical protein